MRQLKSNWKKILIPSLILTFVLMTACSKNETTTVPKETTTVPETKTEVTVPKSERSPTQDFELLTGEGLQTLTGTLQQGDGYSFYRFEGYSMDSASGRLTLEANPGYYAVIKPLPSDYNLNQLRTEGEKALAKSGKVTDYSGELVEHPLRMTELYLQASGENGVHDYLIWKSAAGDPYLFEVYNPKDGNESLFAATIFVSLSTVQTN